MRVVCATLNHFLFFLWSITHTHTLTPVCGISLTHLDRIHTGPLHKISLPSTMSSLPVANLSSLLPPLPPLWTIWSLSMVTLLKSTLWLHRTIGACTHLVFRQTDSLRSWSAWLKTHTPRTGWVCVCVNMCSLSHIGTSLYDTIHCIRNTPVSIVAHSMGLLPDRLHMCVCVCTPMWRHRKGFTGCEHYKILRTKRSIVPRTATSTSSTEALGYYTRKRESVWVCVCVCVFVLIGHTA